MVNLKLALRLLLISSGVEFFVANFEYLRVVLQQAVVDPEENKKGKNKMVGWIAIMVVETKIEPNVAQICPVKSFSFVVLFSRLEIE